MPNKFGVGLGIWNDVISISRRGLVLKAFEVIVARFGARAAAVFGLGLMTLDAMRRRSSPDGDDLSPVVVFARDAVAAEADPEMHDSLLGQLAPGESFVLPGELLAGHIKGTTGTDWDAAVEAISAYFQLVAESPDLSWADFLAAWFADDAGDEQPPAGPPWEEPAPPASPRHLIEIDGPVEAVLEIDRIRWETAAAVYSKPPFTPPDVIPWSSELALLGGDVLFRVELGVGDAGPFADAYLVAIAPDGSGYRLLGDSPARPDPFGTFVFEVQGHPVRVTVVDKFQQVEAEGDDTVPASEELAA
jgi:hypothetical protein